VIPTISIAPNGEVKGINPDRLGIRPFWLSLDRPNNTVNVPPLNSTTLLIMSTNLDGPVDITGMSATADGNFLASIALWQSSNNKRPLMMSPIHSDTVFGTGGQPYPLPEVLRVNQLQKLAFSLTNLETTEIEVQICCLGRQLQKNIRSEREAKMQRQGDVTFPYFMTLDGGKAVVGANATAEIPLTVGTNLDFQMFQISGVSTSTYTLDIVDADTGESIIGAPADSNYGIANNLIVGSNVYPFRFSQPRMVKRGQRLIARIIDTSGSSNTIYLTIGGRAILRGESPV